MRASIFLLFALLTAGAVVTLNAPVGAVPDAPTSDTTFAAFVESDFPFITTTVDADTLASYVPGRNWAVRGVVVALGDSTYYTFDPDLLRMSVAWKGAYVSMRTMAMVSYHAIEKTNGQPRVLGDPIVGTGMYPGWMGERLTWEDPRPPAQDSDNPGRGPLGDEYGTYRGLYVDGDAVVFSYDVRKTRIFERPGRIDVAGESAVSRTFQLSAAEETLHLVAAEVPSSRVESASTDEVVFVHEAGDSVTAIRLDGRAHSATSLSAVDGRYAVVRLPVTDRSDVFRVTTWTGPRADLAAFRSAVNREAIDFPSTFARGGLPRWRSKVRTTIESAPDTNAFVYDDINLPIPNPWRRNVRPADISFFEDGRAAVVTFDGDVWIVDGMAGREPVWTRFASGFFEPLSLVVVDDNVIVYGREGLVRLHDFNEDGEADFYEAFAPGIAQSTRTREWPFSVVVRPGGGFFVSQGGALRSGSTRHLEPLMQGFLGGSRFNGTIMSISADGKDVEVYATGFRGPYIGINPETGTLTASDQQDNFVPSTPVYVIHNDGYYGVPATAHRPEPLPAVTPPLLWLPHQVEPSGTSQVWALSRRLGPLNGSMLHVSYGRPGFLRVYVDSAATPIQGSAVPLPYPEDSPLLNAELNPSDGLLYMVGFKIYGSSAARLASIQRLRYTGLEHDLPRDLVAGQQGIVLQFEEPFRRPRPEDIRVRRWNYQRTGAYGSGHFRLDGSEGEEQLQIAGLHLSEDRRSMLVVLPDMREVMQMRIDFELETTDGRRVSNMAVLTLNDVRPLDLEPFGLDNAPWREDLKRPVVAEVVPPTPPTEASAEKGHDLFQELGCAGCHALEAGASGNFGPTFFGLYGSERVLESGEIRTADPAYLRASILDPAAAIVEGYGPEMPSFRGILAPEDVDSIILFIQDLGGGTE